MKKLFITMMALMAVAVFSATSFASNQVQMTLTSPVIYKAGCEKVGSTTYSFDAGTVIAAGDWWYMDLPENVTLCKSYNYVILGKNDATPLSSPNVFIDYTSSNWMTTVGFNNAGIGNLSNDTASSGGPVNVTRLTGGVGTGTTSTGNMAFLVKGASGQRRITIYALTDSSAASIAVATDNKLNIKLFDGQAHSFLEEADPLKTGIALDLDGNGVYGENENEDEDEEVIGGNAGVEATSGQPYVENTLCVNAAAMSGQYLFTSYASRSDKFTFTGDSQIAHTGTAATIALASCKGDAEDTIEIGGGQDATCTFEYEDHSNYCDTDFENRLLIEASSGAFGDIGDKYYVELEITSPSDGVYFGGLPAVNAFRSTDDACDVVGDDLGATFYAYDGSTRLTSYTADTDCAVGANGRATRMVQYNTMLLTDYDTIWINMPQFTYTNSAVAAGEVITVDVTLSRYPCGEIFTDSLDIGTFITECGDSASETTLYFPWLPGTAATGWWGGFVITNVGTTDGAATLRYSDSTGAQATLAIGTIVAGAQWVNTDVTADDLTDVSGFDMSLNYSVKATCGFSARGFAFTGNGTEGTGYLANGNSDW